MGKLEDYNPWRGHESAPECIIVMTKIDDELGVRNEQKLKKLTRPGADRPLWWAPDGSMYVYYTPTHWRYV